METNETETQEKSFDAVEMTRRIRDQHHEELTGKSQQERLRYYRTKSKALRRRLGLESPTSQENSE